MYKKLNEIIILSIAHCFPPAFFFCPKIEELNYNKDINFASFQALIIMNYLKNFR